VAAVNCAGTVTFADGSQVKNTRLALYGPPTENGGVNVKF